MNLTFVFFIALLSLGDLFSASKLSDLDYMFYYHWYIIILEHYNIRTYEF